MFDMDNEIKKSRGLKGKVVLVTTKGKPTRRFVQLLRRFGEFLKAPGRRARSR